MHGVSPCISRTQHHAGPKSCTLIGQCIADSHVESGKTCTLVESDLKNGAHWRHLLGPIHFFNRIQFLVANSKLVLSCLILLWTQRTLQDSSPESNTDYTTPSRRSPRLPIYDRNRVVCGRLKSLVPVHSGPCSLVPVIGPCSLVPVIGPCSLVPSPLPFPEALRFIHWRQHSPGAPVQRNDVCHVAVDVAS